MNIASLVRLGDVTPSSCPYAVGGRVVTVNSGVARDAPLTVIGQRRVLAPAGDGLFEDRGWELLLGYYSRRYGEWQIWGWEPADQVAPDAEGGAS